MIAVLLCHPDPKTEATIAILEVFGPAARELRRRMLANDPHWPRYHFTAPEGWINDPNGPVYHQGTYPASLTKSIAESILALK